MIPNELMSEICKEVDNRTAFYKELSSIGECKDKVKSIQLLMKYYNCDFDSARLVMDFIIDGTPFPSTLSPAKIARNNAEAQELLNKPKCPACGSQHLKKVSITLKVANTALFGIFGTMRYKTFHCDNCGYEW